jgi:hypothetical protein
VALPTIERYRELAIFENEPEVIESLQSKGHIGWFGSKTSRRVLVYFPPGGLVNNASLQSLAMAHGVYKAAKESDQDVALAIFAYGKKIKSKKAHNLGYFIFYL